MKKAARLGYWLVHDERRARLSLCRRPSQRRKHHPFGSANRKPGSARFEWVHLQCPSAECVRYHRAIRSRRCEPGERTAAASDSGPKRFDIRMAKRREIRCAKIQLFSTGCENPRYDCHEPRRLGRLQMRSPQMRSDSFLFNVRSGTSSREVMQLSGPAVWWAS